MSPKITEIAPRTWAVEDEMVRFFLVEGNDTALMIDTGMTGLDVRAIAASLTDRPVILVNTHADMDHIGGNDAFDSLYIHPSELAVYHHTRPYSGMIHPIYEGDTFDLGGRELEVIHLPGHTPGSITLLDIKNRCLIGGDPIQTGGGIYMFGPYRDMSAYIFSLSRLLDRAEDFELIYPSHADLPVKKGVIPDLIQGAEDILLGKLEGKAEEMHGVPVTTYDIGCSLFFCDRK